MTVDPVNAKLTEAARTVVLRSKTFEFLVDIVATEADGIMVNLDAYTHAELKRAVEASTQYNKVAPTPVLAVRRFSVGQVSELVQVITDGVIMMQTALENPDFMALEKPAVAETPTPSPAPPQEPAKSDAEPDAGSLGTGAACDGVLAEA